MDRRTFLNAGGVIAVAAAVEPLRGALAAQPASQAPAQPSQGAMPGNVLAPMPANPKAIEGLASNLLASHYDNNYIGAVNRFNAITKQLADTDFGSAPGFVVNGLKREQLIAENSVVLHEIYFESLGGRGDPAGALAAAMEKDFGSVAKWRAEFSAMGKALGGGSGWVLLTYVPRLGRLMNTWAADHTMTAANSTVLLALDMYEHAYQMEFGAKAGAYVDTFMNIINWKPVAGAFDRVRKA